jgi:hypothetical protein
LLKVQATLDDFRASADDPIPVFLKKAILFIEKEGLDAEGLYRVPGNRAHVDLLFQVSIGFQHDTQTKPFLSKYPTKYNEQNFDLNIWA